MDVREFIQSVLYNVGSDIDKGIYIKLPSGETVGIKEISYEHGYYGRKVIIVPDEDLYTTEEAKDEFGGDH